MFENIELFDKNIDIKCNDCAPKGVKPSKIHMKLNLYIKITDMCNARCTVCSNKGNEKKSKIDIEKLKYVIKYLDEKDSLNRIGITGGEPFLDIETLNNVLNAIFEVKENAFVTINTNGFRIKECLKLDSISKIYGIHISRHHYDDDINKSFFKTNVATLDDIKEVMDKCENKKLIRLNCLLMKSYINNIEEVQKYLNKAAELGIFRCGFVSLMPINKESIDEFINYNDIFKDLPDSFVTTSNLCDMEICECTNGIYLADNFKLVEYYSRMTKKLNCPYARQFVYTSDNHLTVGFNKEPLL